MDYAVGANSLVAICQLSATNTTLKVGGFS